MTYSTIAAELLKQLDQMPLEFQKKVLEYAKGLNTSMAKDKPDKDLLKLAGNIDQDSLKAKEETVEYGCERIDTNARDVEMISRIFTAVIHKEDDLYVAQCLETGTVSQGSTIEEAVSNLKEATELYLDEFPADLHT